MNGQEQEFSAFWKTLANALNGGKTLAEALDEAWGAIAQPEAVSAVEQVAGDVRSGKSLADALAQHPTFFDESVVATITAAEKVGHIRAAASEISRLLGSGQGSDTLTETAGAIGYAANLLRKSLDARASDLQLDPTEDRQGTARMRIDGVLYPLDPPPQGMFQAVVDHFKTLGAMDVAERRLPQDGRCVDKDYAMRISTAPVHHGERARIRLLTRQPQRIVLGLDKLGLDETDLAKMRRLAHSNAGLVIVNGPTGCGKTTLLYSMLIEIARPEINILTVEDPVELAINGVGQMGLRPDVGLTFPRAIRSILRQSPNVIMVGEIRDLETAELCQQAGITGHSVLTTLHANTSPEAVGRLLDLGIQPWLLSACLTAVISMRLVRVLCPHCRKPTKPETIHLPPTARRLVESAGKATFFAAVGCDKCGGHGFAGRTGIYEILLCEDRLRQAITSGGGLPALREAALAAGMRTMLLDGIEKAARGITTVEQVLQTVPIQEWQ